MYRCVYVYVNQIIELNINFNTLSGGLTTSKSETVSIRVRNGSI